LTWQSSQSLCRPPLHQRRT